jgi:Leucine-rich repeat (LRR) protein
MPQPSESLFYNMPGLTPAQDQGIQVDVPRLRALKDRVGHPALLASWEVYSVPCAPRGWRHVSCGPDGAIAEVRLPDMGLTGQLESLTLSFGKLRALDLSRNTLFGMMPHFSGSLRELNLSDNAFSGPLRDDMAYLQQLEVLDLSGNNFQVRVLGGAWQCKQQVCLVCASHAPNLCFIRLRNQSGG